MYEWVLTIHTPAAFVFRQAQACKLWTKHGYKTYSIEGNNNTDWEAAPEARIDNHTCTPCSVRRHNIYAGAYKTCEAVGDSPPELLCMWAGGGGGGGVGHERHQLQ